MNSNPAPLLDDMYEVEKIIGVSADKQRYLVKWRGYDESENSWEPRENLNDAALATICKIPGAKIPDPVTAPDESSSDDDSVFLLEAAAPAPKKQKVADTNPTEHVFVPTQEYIPPPAAVPPVIFEPLAPPPHAPAHSPPPPPPPPPPAPVTANVQEIQFHVPPVNPVPSPAAPPAQSPPPSPPAPVTAPVQEIQIQRGAAENPYFSKLSNEGIYEGSNPAPSAASPPKPQIQPKQAADPPPSTFPVQDPQGDNDFGSSDSDSLLEVPKPPPSTSPPPVAPAPAAPVAFPSVLLPQTNGPTEDSDTDNSDPSTEI
ncbi:hypothetical protein TrVE_jg13343 [Triparma verrucosa]|uniref:Chromo domain-containing protein n=1 Tax=Triparma verrucosa TaxID=1606542 RepID=A0A9W7BZD4_9STRA|nr:hypothetical protein TrVE_jg13343 [Triparma verrucosa]